MFIINNMLASINQIKTRFNKKQLFILLDASFLPKDGTKQILAERIFELKKTYEELCDIIDDETNGVLCCICLNKGQELDMYSCKTCKEGIVCQNCITNESFNNYDDKFNELCPICKVSPMYSNYEKTELKIKCDAIKEFSEKNNISISELCKIIKTIKEEQLLEENTKIILSNNDLSASQKFRQISELRFNVSKLLSSKLKTININVIPATLRVLI